MVDKYPEAMQTEGVIIPNDNIDKEEAILPTVGQHKNIKRKQGNLFQYQASYYKNITFKGDDDDILDDAEEADQDAQPNINKVVYPEAEVSIMKP